MLEVVFSNSAKGSMSCGLRNRIFCFELGLDVGRIAGRRFWAEREQELKHFSAAPENDCVYAEHVAGSVGSARSELDSFLKAAAHDSVRIWTSAAADDACGACWLAERIVSAGLRPETYIVTLPDFTARADGTSIIMRGWGEASPKEWTELEKLSRVLPYPMLLSMAMHWQKLRQENSPMRAFVNRSLLSAPEDFYDSFIERELDMREGEFNASELVSAVMMRVNAIGDGLIWRRIEALIERGLIVQVTKAEADDMPYRCIIRKK